MDIYILQKRMDSLQEAFIHVRDVSLRMRALYFTSSELLTKKHPLTPL